MSAPTFIRNKHGLRIPDELTKHRVLGDLTRTPVIDNITAFRPSHKLNQELVPKLMSERGSWKWNTDELS